jgi:hypothetical protein
MLTSRRPSLVPSSPSSGAFFVFDPTAAILIHSLQSFWSDLVHPIPYPLVSSSDRLLHSVCANRIFVQDGIYDKFAAALATAVRAFKVGEGNLEGITHGPLIHQAAVDKVARHVESAKSAGAKVLVGGARLDVPGFFYEVSIDLSCAYWSETDEIGIAYGAGGCRTMRH